MRKQGKGRWTSLFDGESTMEEQMARAVEVSSRIRLFDIEGLDDEFKDDFSYVHIIFDELPGWEEPLWATDSQWLYVRRPQGIWKTALPEKSVQGRIGVIFQRRLGREEPYGGTHIGRHFADKPQWRYCSQPTEPEEMDFPAGVDDEGREIGGWLESPCDGPAGRLTLLAGPAFDRPPIKWAICSKSIIATGDDGREVSFPYDESFRLIDAAQEGRLWLRFEVITSPWMEPFDAQVLV